MYLVLMAGRSILKMMSQERGNDLELSKDCPELRIFHIYQGLSIDRKLFHLMLLRNPPMLKKLMFNF